MKTSDPSLDPLVAGLEEPEPECATLGAILRWPSALDDVAAFLRAEHFRTDAHQKLYRALLALHGQRPVDLVTLAEHLRESGELADVGGAAYLARLWGGSATGANAEYYARSVRDAYLRRTLGHLARDMAREAESPSMSASEALEAFERALWALSEDGRAGGEATPLEDDFGECLRVLEQDRPVGAGVATGFTDLDALLAGLQPQQLCLVGARPSVGKTGWALTAARHLAQKEGVPVLFVSLEQSRSELANRYLSGSAGVDSQHLRQGRLSHEEAERVWRAVQLAKGLPLYVSDFPQQTPTQIAALARREVRRRGIQCVFIDYLQLITPEDKKAQRYEQVGQISRRLKALAREMNLPVIALAQLNRSVENAKREPRLSDLRESGSLEADADVVLLLHRDEDATGNIIPVDVIVGKNRNGPRGRITLAFNAPSVTFENFQSGDPRWS